MQNLVITKEQLDPEREVVKEEYRLRFENEPISKAVPWAKSCGARSRNCCFQRDKTGSLRPLRGFLEGGV